jgi:hypothetical protein
MRSFGLRPQDDEENFIIIYLTKDSPICHSERSEESHAFNEFLTQRFMYNLIHKTKILSQIKRGGK